MRRILQVLAAAALAGAVLAGAALMISSGNGEIVSVRIEKGSSAREISAKLGESGVLSHPSLFLALARATGMSRKFKSGPYLLENNHYWGALRKISRGETHKIKVVIPEGWTAFQIATRLAEEGVLPDAESFAAWAKEQNLEGRLFPSSYFFEPGSSPQEIAAVMEEQYKKVFTPEMEERAKVLRMTPAQALTLASIIEREARFDDERSTISSVYHNRLRIRMALEADPTVQYALSSGRAWKERLFYKDLRFQSPYNTYRNRGLPPGPICNPGAASIRAALNPASTPFLYFVADGTGRHMFFTTPPRPPRLAEKASKKEKALEQRKSSSLRQLTSKRLAYAFASPSEPTLGERVEGKKVSAARTLTESRSPVILTSVWFCDFFMIIRRIG